MRIVQIRPFATPASALCLSLFYFSAPHTSVANLYWDGNSTTAGAGIAPAGTWGSSAFWSTDPLGLAATTAWTSGETAVFAAGTDASGPYNVVLSGTQTAAGIIVEEGTVNFGASGAVAVGAGSITINPGATLSIDNSARVTSTAGSKLFLDGSTIQNTVGSNAGTFFNTNSEIVLGANGGTLSFTTPNILNIVQTASHITGPGSLTKTGAGVLGIASTAGFNTYAGATIVNDGELRIRQVVNTLPTTTDVIVNSPGIFNLNGVSQQVGSLTGTGNVGTGSGTLTISGSASTTFDGALKNIANAGAGAVTTGNGRLVKSGTGVITFNGLNDINGSVTLNAGGIVVTAGASLCGPIADVTVAGGTLTLNNPAQTIENLSGAGGTIVLGSNHVLTSDPIASTTYSGTIAGAGGLTRLNASGTTRTLTLSGNNSYDGLTTVGAGIISVGSASALGSTLSGTSVASGAEILFTGAATNFTVNEPFSIAGTGPDGGAIAVQASAAPTIAGPVTLTADATVTVSGAATVTYTNPNSFTSVSNQSLTLQGGTPSTGNGGTITGAIALSAGNLTKLQAGTWTLAGSNIYTGATTITSGTLNVTGSISGTSGVSVSGTLAGNGTITPSLGGGVSLQAGGKLSPGPNAGNLSLILSGGGTLSLTAGITGDTGALLFELDTPASSDKITLTGGALDIGTGVLEFDDFSFTTLAGFTEQTTYTLFDGNTPIVGSFGAIVDGFVGASPAQLQFANGGTDIVLVVVPEPSSSALLLASLALVANRRRGR